jgi:hypothetical protein
VDFFSFVAWMLVIVVGVTAIWPLNIPLLALAVKVRQGTQKLDYEVGEFWWRCTFGALGLAVFTLILLGLCYGLVVEMEFGQQAQAKGTIQLVLLAIYVPVAVLYLFWILALEDMLQALSVFLLYVGLPGLPLLLLGWLIGLWSWLSANAPWLMSS